MEYYEKNKLRASEVSQKIYPIVVEATGEHWIQAGTWLHSSRTLIYYQDRKLHPKTPIFESLKKRFPSLTNDDFKFKLTAGCSQYFPPPDNTISYIGIILLNCNGILDRGKIAGQKFGL